MKIARVEVKGEVRVGIVTQQVIALLARDVLLDDLLAASPADRAEIVERSTNGAPRDLGSVRLLPPVMPKTLRDFVTFEEHLEGSLKGLGMSVHPAWYDQPVFFFQNTNSVLGPDDDVEVPPGCERLDFELELAAVIGKAGKDLTPEKAADHIAGYTLYNDWSARDLMTPVLPIGVGPVKGKDFANTLGPWIVTADELEPYRRDDRLALEMHVEVNGDPLPAGGDNSASMSWSFEEMVAYASRGAELVPGDVLAAGTCGAGSLLEYWAQNGTEDPPSLRPGDVVTLAVEGIGSLTTTIVPGAAPVEVPRARTTSHRRARVWSHTAS